MGTTYAPLVADLFMFRYESDFMISLSDDKRADIIDAFNTTSRYLDDISNINTVYFGRVVGRICPSELQLNRANASDARVRFWTSICQFLMILFLPKFMINLTILVLRLSVSPLLMLMFLDLHRVASVLLEHLGVLPTSTLTINCRLRIFLDKAIGTIGFKGLFWIL